LLPGVADATFSVVTPVIGRTVNNRVDVSGGVPLPDEERVAFVNFISSEWFSTFGTPLVAGRDLTDRDRNAAPPVAIVNQAFARKFLNGASPIGHTITVSIAGPRPRPPMDIVGVAGSARDR